VERERLPRVPEALLPESLLFEEAGRRRRAGRVPGVPFVPHLGRDCGPQV